MSSHAFRVWSGYRRNGFPPRTRLSVAPAVLKAVLQALQTVLSRQPTATKVLIQTKGGQVSFEFDPKRISLQELVSAAERLGAAAPPA